MSNSSSVINSKLFFVKILVPYILGILVFYMVPDWWIPVTKVCIITLLILLLLANAVYSRIGLYNKKGLVSTLIYLYVFLGAAFNTLTYNEKFKENYFAIKPASFLKVKVADEVKQKGNIIRFKAQVLQNILANGFEETTGYMNVAIRLSSDKSFNISYGDQLIIPAKYRPIQPVLNPSTFDYQGWQASQNVFEEGFFDQGDILKTRISNGDAVIKYALDLRQRQINYLKKYLDSTACNFASALILGYRLDVDGELLEVYSKTGTVHALSVSGMHVGLIYLLLNWLLAFMNRRKHTCSLKFIIILGIIWFYTVLSGLSPSAVRSAVMLSVFIIGKTLNRNPGGYNTLAFTPLVMLVIDPYLIWDVGFQLSFIAVFGLVFFHPVISGWINTDSKIVNAIWTAISISLSAQLATSPVSIYYFHQFPTYFLISNLFIGIPITILMYGGLIILLLRLTFLFPIFEWLISFTNSWLAKIANLPGASLTGIWVNKIEVLILYALIMFCSLSLIRKSKIFLFLAIAAYTSFLTISCFTEIAAQKQKIMVVYNLKKHYVIAFIKGKHAIIIANLQKNHPLFIKQVLPYLENQRIDSIKMISGNEDFNGSFLVASGDDISFVDYQMSKADLLQIKLKNGKAIIKYLE